MITSKMVYVTPAEARGSSCSAGTSRFESWMFCLALSLSSSLAASAVDLEVDGCTDCPTESLPSSGMATTEERSGGVVVQALASGRGMAASVLESLLAALDAFLLEMGIPATPMQVVWACAALVVCIIACEYVRKVGGGGIGGGGSAKSKGVVLFLGPCSSGKTAICYRMSHDHLPPTVTSMQPCTYEYKVKEGGGSGGGGGGGSGRGSGPSASIIDYPGHERLRGGVSEVLRRADRVVFVLDGSCLAAQIAAGAELLYDVLTDPALERCRGLLLALNKSDIKDVKVVRAKTLLCKELDKLRGTRGTLGTQGEEDDMPVALALGRPGQPFSLEVDSPCKVEIAVCSAKDGSLDPVTEFVRASLL